VRHAYATASLEAGVPLKVLSERLGHSSITITGDTYQHVRQPVDQDAADLTASFILGNGA
jgi:integrase